MQTAIQESPTAEEATGYLRLYPNRDTVAQHRWGLRTYLRIVTGKEPSRTPEDLEVAARTYLDSKPDPKWFRRDVETFFSSIMRSPPKTINSLLSFVQIFLARNGVSLGEFFWKDLHRKIKGNRAVTVDSVPTNEELRRIISHLPILGRSIVLTASSSGARIGELLKIDLGDLDMKSDPIRLTIRAETSKSGGLRIVFASREAKESLEEWMRVRSAWLRAAVKKTTATPLKDGRMIPIVKSATDTRLFPVSAVTVNDMYTIALTKAGFLKRDPTTGMATFHFHVLRKFFRTRLGPTMNLDVIEALMGHEAYLTQSYRRYTLDQMAEFYRKAEPALWILSDVGEASLKVDQTRTALEEQLRQQAERIKALESVLLRKLRALNSLSRKASRQESRSQGPLASRWRSQAA